MWKRNTILGALEELQRWTWLVDSRNGIALCKRGNRRLLDKMFESKPIKRGVKIPFRQLKAFIWTRKTNNFSIFHQQQLRYCSHFSKPIHFQKTKQYGPGLSHIERKRRLDNVISQDIKGPGDNDWCTENGKGYQEDGWKSKYNDNRNWRIHFNSKHQQQDNKYNEYYLNIRGPLILGSKRYGWTSISGSENVSW